MRTKRNPKARYRLRNWKEYNAALVHRGSLTLWLDEEAVSAWFDTESTMHRMGHRRGHPRKYSSLAITCMLTLKAVYHLPLRATVGLVQSVMGLMGYPELPVAHSSTLSRRSKSLAVPLPVTHCNEPINLVVDSTGLKVYGEGEWKTKKHGWTRHRTWRKVHIGMDVDTFEFRVIEVTEPKVGDSEMLPQLLAAEQSALSQVIGDGGYESRRCHEAVAMRPERPRAIFPPRRERRRGRPVRPDRGHPRSPTRRTNARYSNHIWQHGNCKAIPLDRDEHVRRIRQVGRARWKEEVGYHKRSLVETGIWRFKIITGASLSSRKASTQLTEVRIRAAVVNRMTALGMPDSYLVHNM